MRDENRRLRREHKELREKATHDALTGLPNRELLQDRFRVAIKRAQHRKLQLAVAFLDLDRFKPLNDRHGHSTGDELLQKVADRIKSALRAGDTVARIGGDEFVVLLEGLEHAEAAVAVVEKLHDVVTAPAVLHSELRDEMVSVRVAASIGIALAPGSGSTLNELLNHADRMMYEAKRDGGGVRADLSDRRYRSGETVKPLRERRSTAEEAAGEGALAGEPAPQRRKRLKAK